MATNQAQPTVEPKAPSPAPRRRWWFKAVAVLLGIAPFVGFELLCIAFDWGHPNRHDDPFVGFRSVVPLFVPSADRSRYEIAPARLLYFFPDSFPVKKQANEFRIFCLGGSDVQGHPFATDTSFPTWLRLSLEEADPTRRWTVVNCGGVSYASYRLVPILEEVLGYEPDLIIFCTGHNEFLEARSFDHVANRGSAVNAALAAASHLRSFTLAREAYLGMRGQAVQNSPERRPILPTEVEALLDYRGGMETYHRDDAWRHGVIEQFEFNLRRMVEMARKHGVDVLLMNPTSNLSDSPPFKSEHAAGLSSEKLAEWEDLCRQGSELQRAGPADALKAVRLFEQACKIDPLHAGGFYGLGKCYEAAGNLEQAREAYLKARELDVCPLRILQPMSEAVLRIARETDTPLVDAQELFASRTQGGIVGGYWLVDHVHPSIEGHQLLADTLADKLVTLGKLHPRSEWQAAKSARYQAHLDSLGDLYFMKGMERLKSLRSWSQGRSEIVRPADKSSSPQ